MVGSSDELKRLFVERRAGKLIPLLYVDSLNELMVAERREENAKGSNDDNLYSLDLRRFSDREINRVVRVYHDRWLQLLIAEREQQTSVRRDRAEFDYLLKFFRDELAYIPHASATDTLAVSSSASTGVAALEIYEKLDVINRVMADRLLTDNNPVDKDNVVS